MNRRSFIKSATLAAGSFAMPRAARAAASTAANTRLNLAFIGCGGQGSGLIRSMTGENIAAFCDVDDRRAAQVFAEFPNVPRYRDYRVMLDKLAGKLDAVVVCTPDHTHVAAGLHAIQLGLHVYVEKPMARTIEEVRMLEAAARKHRVVSQMGIQGHATEGIRIMREWIDSGVIGAVRDVYLWSDHPKPAYVHHFDVDPPQEPIPPGFDWDLWLGPARDRPFNSRYAPYTWRGWWQFGSGALGNIAIHMWDVVEYALEVGFPDRVEGEADRISPLATPHWSTCRFHHPARSARPAVTVHWFSGHKDGRQFHPRTADIPFWPEGRAMEAHGMAFAGEMGTLYVPDMRASTRPFLFPEERWLDFRANLPGKTLPRFRGSHYDDWFDAIRTGRKAGADFAYSAALTEAVFLGNLALHTGKPIVWDRAAMRAKDVPEADEFVRTYARKGWELAGT